MKRQQNAVYGFVQGAGLLMDTACPDDPGGKFPVILSVHGGRWIRGRRDDTSAINVEQWARFGFFAMSISYRLVTCSPAPACYQDVQCAIRWVHAHADRFNLDTKRIYLIGMSAGGHMVSLAATLGDGDFARTGGWEDQPNTFRAAISVSGAYELKKLDWGSGWMPPGVDWDEARAYASPINHVGPSNRPILFLHSDDDRSVPVANALAFDEASRSSGAPHRFIHYTDRGHMPINEAIIAEARRYITDQG